MIKYQQSKSVQYITTAQTLAIFTHLPFVFLNHIPFYFTWIIIILTSANCIHLIFWSRKRAKKKNDFRFELKSINLFPHFYIAYNVRLFKINQIKMIFKQFFFLRKYFICFIQTKEMRVNLFISNCPHVQKLRMQSGRFRFYSVSVYIYFGGIKKKQR